MYSYDDGKCHVQYSYDDMFGDESAKRLCQVSDFFSKHRLRWFGHVQRRPPEAPVRNEVLERVDNVKRGRCRPKLTWDESVKRDLKD